jgi:phage terminase small subunit
MPKLTPKQKKFCREYVVSLNATQAAVKAKYKNPNVIGSQNLTKLSIQDEIKRLQADIDKKAKKNGEIIDPIELLESYTRDIMFDPGDMLDKKGKILPLHKVPKEVRMCLMGIDVGPIRTKTNPEIQ